MNDGKTLRDPDFQADMDADVIVRSTPALAIDFLGPASRGVREEPELLVRISRRFCLPHEAGNWAPARLGGASGVDARYAVGASSASRSARWFDWAGERFSADVVGDGRRLHCETAVDPVGTADACCRLPHRTPSLFTSIIVESTM